MITPIVSVPLRGNGMKAKYYQERAKSVGEVSVPLRGNGMKEVLPRKAG